MNSTRVSLTKAEIEALLDEHPANWARAVLTARVKLRRGLGRITWHNRKAKPVSITLTKGGDSAL